MKVQGVPDWVRKCRRAVNGLWDEEKQPGIKKKENPMQKSRWENVQQFIWLHKWELLVMLLLGAFVYYVASIQPLDSGPDEEMRYMICRYIYQHGTLPKGTDPEVINKVWGVSYAFKPMLTCILGGYLMRVAGIFNEDPHFLLMTARLVNVILCMGFAWYVMQIAKRLFHGIYRVFFTALILLLPQLTYLFTYVNNDGIALFSTAMIVYYWLRGIDTRWDQKSCTGTAVGCAVCMLSYYNSYGFLLMSAVLFAVTMFFQYRELGRKRYGLIIKRGLYVLAIVFVLAGWWFIRNAVIYDGDFLGMRVIKDCAEQYAIHDYKPSVKRSLFQQGVSLKEMLTGDAYLWLQETYYSFIAFFGAKKYHLGVDIYQIHKHLLYPALFGWGVIGVKQVLGLYRRIRKREKSSQQWKTGAALHVALAVCLVIPVFLSLYYSYMDDFQPQGRYIMPMVIPLMYFWAMGTAKGLEFVFKRKGAWILMIPQFYGVIHVFYDAYVNVCLPAFGVTVPFLDPVFPWWSNNVWFDRIRNFIMNGLFPG